jgi:hypothetical protein
VINALDHLTGTAFFERIQRTKHGGSVVDV